MKNRNDRLINYTANNIKKTAHINASEITLSNGAVDRKKVLMMLIREHEAGTTLLLSP